MNFFRTFAIPNAGVLELVDNPDLGSGALRRMGSSPFTRTKGLLQKEAVLFCLRKSLKTGPIARIRRCVFWLDIRVYIAINRESPYLCWGVIKQMTMETRDKYTSPETEVLELQTEGVIADSECSNDGDPD